MTFKISTSSIFNCTLQRAFKTPMLCDISKVHTGYCFIPKVTHCTDEENWGQPGSSKKVFAAKSLTQKGGYISIDKVIERIENRYWKIEVSNFQTWMLGFFKFVGEWETTELEPNKILVKYTYSLYSNKVLLYPLNWLFAQIFWRIYMKRVTENIRKMAYNNEPFKFN